MIFRNNTRRFSLLALLLALALAGNLTFISGTSARPAAPPPPSGCAVVGWGDSSVGQATPPAGLSNVTAIAAGDVHSLALKSDGTVVGWGYTFGYGAETPPAGLSDVTAISAAHGGGIAPGLHSLALKSDGTVVGWGFDGFGQATPPAGLSGVTAIAAGGFHSLALKSDGTVVGWGDDSYGQATPPAGLSNVVAISAGSTHSLALKSDGTVVGWGDNDWGQATPPAGLSNVTAISAGYFHSLALYQCGPSNTPPTISAVANSRQQGVAASASTIATVGDADQSAGSLTVTVNGGAAATVNGVTVSGLVNTNGTISVTIGASCTASNASFTLTVTDSASATATATLNVTVTANSAPTLGSYPSAGPITVGAGTTVTPSAAPADNVSVASVTVSGSAGFTGTLSVSPATGVVTISNAGPAGMWVITVTVTDNCGATTIRQFTLTVVAAGPQLGQFVVFSKEHTQLRANAKVFTGNVGANTSLPDPNGGADDKEEVEIGQDVKMLQAGSKVIGDTVRTRSGSQVYDVHFNEEFFSPTGTILGAQTTPQSLPVLASLPALPAITPGATDVNVPANQTMTLAAGAYRNITVNHDATLILTGGVYHMEKLDIRQDAKLHFTAATEVRIKNEMDTDAKAYIGPAPSAPSLPASQIIFYCEGADDGGDLASTVVQIGERNTVKANFYAPNGTVYLRANTVATGAFIGKRAQIGERVELTLKSAF